MPRVGPYWLIFTEAWAPFLNLFCKQKNASTCSKMNHSCFVIICITKKYSRPILKNHGQLPLFICRHLVTSQPVCPEKSFNYHICYENIGGKHNKRRWQCGVKRQTQTISFNSGDKLNDAHTWKSYPSLFPVSTEDHF